MLYRSLFMPYTTPMNRTNVETIKERVPIEELVGSYVKLEKAGKSFKGKCPFHNEKTASFFVSPDRGGYYCFGCGAKGDIFSFVEQFEGLDFKGALKILAEKAGVQLTYDVKADSEKDFLFKIMDDAAKYFEDQYEASKPAQEYVKGRGITDETRTIFRIGWAPNEWRALSEYLKKKGWKEPLMEKAGLIKKKDQESATAPNSNLSQYYDRFRGRIMFPISDSSGRVIAFTGRVLVDDGKSAKYMNSPDMPLFDKSSVLFGLDKAKGEIRRLNYAIMVEGQMDLIMSHQAGIRNIVAASGTALTDDGVNKDGIVNNLGLVRRLSPNLIIAFDSDAAGRKAALRAAGIALSLGMDVKIADIVGGKDPADLVKEDPEQWKAILRKTKPVVEFELENVLRDETDKRKVPRALAARVFPLLASMDSRSDQDFFVKMIADRAHIDAGAIWDDLRIVKERVEKEAQKNAAIPGQQQASPRPGSKMSSELPKHIDLVERRMFGLLAMMEKAAYPKAPEYREQIRKIADATYAERVARVEAVMNDVAFEAEAFFSTDQRDWDVHMKELVLNFDADVIDEELMKAMQDLRVAEKAADHTAVAELAKKCQVLSIRKAEIGKRRKN